MKKIPTLFKRNPEDMRRVLPEVTPGCEWVLAGEGTPTRKYDGTCVMLDEEDRWWARREVKPGKQAPANFLAVETDENTGKTVGWEPIDQSPFAKFHAEALDELKRSTGRNVGPMGTFELCGPKINGNPERIEAHRLVSHEQAIRLQLVARLPARTVAEFFAEIQADLKRFPGWEGIVWHHPDGRMAKLKVRDFYDPFKD